MCFGVHCVGGIIGALGTGILVNPALGGAGIMDYTRDPAEGRRLRLRRTNDLAVLGRLHHAGVVGHRLSDPLQGRRCHVGLSRQRRTDVKGLDVTEHTERATIL